MSELKKQNVPDEPNRKGHGEGPYLKTQRESNDVPRETSDVHDVNVHEVEREDEFEREDDRLVDVDYNITREGDTNG